MGGCRRQRRIIRTFPGHGGALGEARFHPAGKLLVSCGEDNFVKFWNVTPAPQLVPRRVCCVVCA
jgi:WD40 repeat protein